MTSNIGSTHIRRAGRWGFQSENARLSLPRPSRAARDDRGEAHLSPEFINRIDEIIVFDALSGERDLLQVSRLMIEQLEPHAPATARSGSCPATRSTSGSSRRLPGPLVRGPSAAPGDPASHRGRAVREPDPGTLPEVGDVEVMLADGRLLFRTPSSWPRVALWSRSPSTLRPAPKRWAAPTSRAAPAPQKAGTGGSAALPEAASRVRIHVRN